MNHKKKYNHKLLLIIAVLVLYFSCYCPSTAYAAKSESPEKPPSITAMSVMLFYAGVIGALVGATTGWVNAWFYRAKPESKPLNQDINKP